MGETQPILVEIDASRFRGEYLDHCSLIEDHATHALGRLVALGLLKKVPLLFGLKFKALVEHANAPEVWMHGRHVAQALEKLKPFVELRSAICHAVMSDATIEGQPGISWRMPGEADWQYRKTLTDREMRDLLAELGTLTAKFRNQRMKPVSPASSPPQP
jgi:hypothetical protein